MSFFVSFLQDALRIINKALSEGMTKEAAEKVKDGIQFEHLGGHAAITSLINQSPAKQVERRKYLFVLGMQGRQHKYDP